MRRDLELVEVERSKRASVWTAAPPAPGYASSTTLARNFIQQKLAAWPQLLHVRTMRESSMTLASSEVIKQRRARKRFSESWTIASVYFASTERAEVCKGIAKLHVGSQATHIQSVFLCRSVYVGELMTLKLSLRPADPARLDRLHHRYRCSTLHL